MGIVTWGSIGCRPLPEIKKTFLIASQKVEDLIDFTYKLLWKKLGEECFVVNNIEFAKLFCKDEHEADVFRSTAPAWLLVFSIEGYGMLPEQRVEYQEKELMELAQLHGLQPATLIAGITSERVTETLSGPSYEPYWKLRDRGGCHDLFFLTTLDRTNEFIAEMERVVGTHNFSPGSVGVYLQPTVLGCNCHCEFNLAYDPSRASEINDVKRLDEDAVLAFSKKGAFFNRPYGSWVDVAYQHATDTISAQRKLKTIFDPNAILNPGKLCF
jgi:FAD/FMN-containing dehydrogenase